jgi:hypothetical protein
VKICIAVVIGALIFCVLALKDLDANAGGGSGPELAISYKPLRAYDQATNTFTGVSYLIETTEGPGCSAVLAVDASSELAINALGVEDGLHTWSGTRREFSATGLPNPCP